MIRVVVADDQALVRGGFRVLVDSAPDLEVVGEASDGTEAVALARKTKPRDRQDARRPAAHEAPGP
jgi:DNA-binding NarL/FixJ family response regulator